MSLSLVSLCSGLVLTAPPASPNEDVVPLGVSRAPLTVHARELEAHRGALPRVRAPGFGADAAARRRPRALAGTGLEREVYGYLPYWVDYDDFRWDLLTTLAWFSAELNATGDITDDHGWFDSASIAALRDDAKANGVRFVLTVTLFDGSAIATLVNSAMNRANAIENLVDAVVTMEADGVNVDFEGVPSSAKAGLVTFVTDLEAAMTAATAIGHVTVATPAVDWNGSFDYDALAEACDGLMIMGYDYHYPGGNPGPNSPLTAGDIWSKWSLTWTLDDYFQYGKASNKHKFILGLPFFGFDWPSESTAIPGVATGKGKAVTWAVCKAGAPASGFEWDPHSQTGYYMTEQGGEWHQVWCDDAPSWEAKMQLVESYDIGGIGIWALGYDAGTSDYWDLIEEYLVAPPIVVDGDAGTADAGPADAGPTDGGSADVGPTGPDAGGPIDEPDVAAGDAQEIPADEVWTAPDADVGASQPSGDAGGDGVDVAPADEPDAEANGGVPGAGVNARTIGAARVTESGGCGVHRHRPYPGLLTSVFLLALGWGLRRQSRRVGPRRPSAPSYQTRA